MQASVINCNYSQTRKSGLTGPMEKISRLVDNHVRQQSKDILEEKIRTAPPTDETSQPAAPGGKGQRKKRGDQKVAQHLEQIAEESTDFQEGSAREDFAEEQEEDAESPIPSGTRPPVASRSVSYLGGTIERAKERCSGDFNMVRNAKTLAKLPAVSKGIAQEKEEWSAEASQINTRPGLWGKI